MTAGGRSVEPAALEGLGGCVPFFHSSTDRPVDQLGVLEKPRRYGTGEVLGQTAHWSRSETADSGQYIALSGVVCLLRSSANAWATQRATPIWLQVGYQGKPAGSAILEALRPLSVERDRVFPFSKCVDIAIDLPTGVEQDAVVEAMAGQLARVAVLLRPIGDKETPTLP